MSKKKSKGQWKDYKTFTLKDGTKFHRDEKDEPYRKKVGGNVRDLKSIKSTI